MHVRVAKFEGIDPDNLDEMYAQFRNIVRMEERPDAMPEEVFEVLRSKVRRVLSVADRENGATLDMTFTDNAEDARAVHEVLDSLSPPEGSGRRTSVATYEVMVDQQL